MLAYFFSNPTVWGIIAFLTLIVGCVTGLPNLITWWHSRRHKKWITIQNVGVVPLLDKNLKEFKGINITYQPQDIKFQHSENLVYFDCIIKNEGEKDILDSDFQTEFSLNINAHWLEANVSSSNSASNFQSNIERTDNENKLIIKFSILKPGDTIRIRSLISIVSHDTDRFFDNMTISDGIKDTVIEKKLPGQANKNSLDDFNLVGTFWLSLGGILFLGCLLLIALIEENKTNTAVKDIVVHYVRKDIDVQGDVLKNQYTASNRDNLVFLKLIDSDNTNVTDQNLVLFQKDFENDFNPIIASDYSNTSHGKTINILNISVSILFLVIFILFIISLVAFIYSSLRLIVRYLSNLFCYTCKKP
jgi:hypothetical protein